MTPTLLDSALIIAAQAHAGQRRRYDQTPYLTHCVEVVNILIRHGVEDEVMLAAAALHDVIEDTSVTQRLLEHSLACDDSYDWADLRRVVDLVVELTEPQHQGNRATRKAAERDRLATISPDAQTIKYADLISNTGSIAEHDPGFARVYLQEKWSILKVMKAGQYSLWDEAAMTCNVAADRIGLELM